MSCSKLQEWYVILSGFLQRSGDLNGMVNIWRDLRTVVPAGAGLERHSWNANVPDLAEFIKRLSVPKPRIVLFGYSWGGMSCINLARELQRREINVERMVLSDAVYRHWFPLGNWRAFAPWRTIRVPSNVGRVTHFRQRADWPRGHKLVAVNPGKTKVDPVQWLDAGHCWMDDAEEFRAACLEAVKGSADDEANDTTMGNGMRPGDVILNPFPRS